MANRQTSGSETSRSSRSARTAGKSKGRSSTGERNEQYDVISVLYHALQGAETATRYIEDARDADDDELVDFLSETKDEYVARAAKAKRILASRLESSAGEEEEEEEEEEEDEEEEEEEDEDEE